MTVNGGPNPQRRERRIQERKDWPLRFISKLTQESPLLIFYMLEDIRGRQLDLLLFFPFKKSPLFAPRKEGRRKERR